MINPAKSVNSKDDQARFQTRPAHGDGAMTAAYGGWQWGKGSYSAPIDLVGALAPAFTFSATFANPNQLRGDMPVVVTIPSTVAPTSLMNLTGDLAPQIVLSSFLGTTIVLGGDLPPASRWPRAWLWAALGAG